MAGNSSIFLERTVTGLESTMAKFYAKKSRCQVGLTSELSRLLLPLAWLVRVRGDDVSRMWLRDVADALLAYVDPSGAIRENPTCWGGAPSNHPPPTSNAAYGTAESTLSQTKNDSVADLLYSFNFALLAMHEAAEATRAGGGVDHARYDAAAARMAAFAIRVQVRASAPAACGGGTGAGTGGGCAPPAGPGTPPVHAAPSGALPARGTAQSLDGAWLRAFDFGRWDFFASASDSGWGPWVAETGHGSSLIAVTLAVRERNTSLWDTITLPGPWRAAIGSAITERVASFFHD